MRIAICGSLSFTNQMKNIADELTAQGHDVSIPISSEKILSGEFSLAEIEKEKSQGNFSDRAIRNDSIRAYWKVVKDADAILVANFDKKDIAGYIGGNTFLEMGFAHVLNKKIYLYQDIPQVSYEDEIRTMQPTVLKGNINLIK